MSDADQSLTIAEIASASQIASENGLTLSGVYRYARNWPDTLVYIDNKALFVRARLAARLADTDLRPRLRKSRRKPPPAAQPAVEESGDGNG
jgi:hypothetical protein